MDLRKNKIHVGFFLLYNVFRSKKGTGIFAVFKLDQEAKSVVAPYKHDCSSGEK